ncbi:unnamed protein product [Durusdinium trenchii]|uniref:Apple domain-containing protein n=1 Tax=Durusdinium trenchii TaxID=1381693 RepID=A0ABP0IIC8_9DINO
MVVGSAPGRSASPHPTAFHPRHLAPQDPSDPSRRSGRAERSARVRSPARAPAHLGPASGLGARRARNPHLHKVMQEVEKRLPEFTCVDLALTAWSIATMKWEPPGLYDRISKLSLACIAEFQPQALANIMWATATLKKENDALIRHAAFTAAKLLDAGQDFRPHEYSTMVWSMVITQAREECLFSRVSGHVLRRVSEFGPQELTNTAWAFASLGIRTEGLFEALGKECHSKLRQFNTQNLTNVAWAYSHLAVGSEELLSDVARIAHARIHEMNVQDLAQLALTLVFTRRSGLDESSASAESVSGVLGTRELTVALVVEVTKAMVLKIQRGGLTTPDDAWIVHDLVMVWMEESEAEKLLGDAWRALDAYMDRLYHQVMDFLRTTPLLARALACGSVVQSAHVPIYEQSFRDLDLRSLGIKYTGLLLEELGLMDRSMDGLTETARERLAEERQQMLRQDPGAGSQNWCLFRFHLHSELREAQELEGIRVRSCGGDPLALELLDPPREAHLVAVKLSNDRLNHRRRDAEFRAIAHLAGVLRSLIPDADRLMQANAFGQRCSFTSILEPGWAVRGFNTTSPQLVENPPHYYWVAAPAGGTTPEWKYCLLESCALATCDAGQLPRTDAAEIVPVNKSDCCEASCGQFPCPSGFTLRADANTTVAHGEGTCCERLCSSFHCPAAFEPIFNAHLVKGDRVSQCCRKLPECQMNSNYKPVDMAGTKPRKVDSAAQCFELCERTPLCSGFSWFRDRSCHLADANASLQFSAHSVSGNRSCYAKLAPRAPEKKAATKGQLSRSYCQRQPKRCSGRSFETVGPRVWNDYKSSVTRGVEVVDWDGDGFLDIVTVPSLISEEDWAGLDASLDLHIQLHNDPLPKGHITLDDSMDTVDRPQLSIFDWDSDGKLDLLLGMGSGRLRFFKGVDPPAGQVRDFQPAGATPIHFHPWKQ